VVARDGGSSWARARRALPTRPRALKRALSLLAALHELGWHRSALARAPVDAAGAPVPWFTYAAILWLEPRLDPSMRVFEYGAGNSTRWFAARCAQVTSVDHDRAWIDRLRPQVPRHVELLARSSSGDDVDAPAGDEYVEAIGDVAAYDVVVIDGRSRLACARRALPHLAPQALAVVDNADRPSLAPVLALASQLGLQRIDLSGPVPGAGRLATTTVLGRDLTRWVTPAPTLPQLGYEGH
jgi:hypothetical protein